MAFDLNEFFRSTTFSYFVLIIAIGFIVYLILKRKQKATLINRPELLKAKRSVVLQKNRVKNWVLKQEEHEPAIISGLGSYILTIIRQKYFEAGSIRVNQLNAEELEFIENHKQKEFIKYELVNEKVFVALYNTIWVWRIPRFWDVDILIVSTHNIAKIEKNKKLYTLWLKKDYFRDMYQNFIISLTDKPAIDFIKILIGLDDTETHESISLAQDFRLTSVDINKPFEARPEEIKMEEVGKT